MTELKPWDEVKLPSEEQKERARTVINKTAGADVFDGNLPMGADDVVTVALIILLNKDKILGFGHE